MIFKFDYSTAAANRWWHKDGMRQKA